MAGVSELGEVYHPDATLAGWHAKRFAAFELLAAGRRAIRG
jgi:D-ribulokinase